MRVLSLGGGTQSCALALMSARGDLPKLDHIVFADTRGELPETYTYLAWLGEQMEAAGIPLHIVSAGDLYADLLSPVPTSSNPTPPAHVRNPDGTKGRVAKYTCSYDYKRRIIDRKVKALVGGRGAWKLAEVEQWVGFSLDEVGRMKVADNCRCGHKQVKHTGACTRCKCERFSAWQTNRWPLVELRMRRDDTIRWFGANGYPTPPRSACYFCPNSGNDRWQTLKITHPDLFANAVHLDETIRTGNGFNDRGHVKFEGEMFLHGSLDPLADADLRTERQLIADSGQGELFNETVLGLDCEAGVCFT